MQDIKRGNQMISAELVEASGFSCWKRIENSIDVVLVDFGFFCQFVSLVKIGLRCTLK